MASSPPSPRRRARACRAWRSFPTPGRSISAARCDRSLAHRLPTVFANRTYLRAGGLFSYGPDLEAAFQRSAYFVERIFKGAQPADLPIEQTTVFHLVLNLRTARALEFKFPRSLLSQADDVIE